MACAPLIAQCPHRDLLLASPSCRVAAPPSLAVRRHPSSSPSIPSLRYGVYGVGPPATSSPPPSSIPSDLELPLPLTTGRRDSMAGSRAPAADIGVLPIY
ncbi:hypothetical protein ACP4OV_002081 [Aristida adscensionis]